METKTDKPQSLGLQKTAVPANSWTDEQRQQIAQRAYDLFLQRGGQHGHQLEDWLKAEAEFASSLKAAKAPKARRVSAAA